MAIATMTIKANESLTQRIVEVFLRGNLSILFIAISLLLGATALIITPREEEPQIVVPMADVFVSAPGLGAEEVERLVSTRLEKLLYQIDGMEHVYSMSRPGQAIVTARFYVGQNREDSLVKIYNKVQSNIDQVPADVTGWVVKPVEIDDVPIVNLTLWSEDAARYDDYALRRIAEEMEIDLQAVPDTNITRVIGGRPRRILVELDPRALAARRTAALDVAWALDVSSARRTAGGFDQGDARFVIEGGGFFHGAEDVRSMVVNVVDGAPVFLRDVANVRDGPDEARSYSWMGFGPAVGASPPGPLSASGEGGEKKGRRTSLTPPPPSPHVERGGTGGPDEERGEAAGADGVEKGASLGGVQEGEKTGGDESKTEDRTTIRVGGDDLYPAVHIAVAKKKGTNAVWVARAVERRLGELSKDLLPDGVHCEITRNYGETANDKVNELVEGLGIAVIIVIGLISLTLGWREGLIVAVAVPITFSLTLFVNHLLGYTINRVTLFALTLALGLVVDDPVVDVENIYRHFKMRRESPLRAVLSAVNEVRPPIILATLAVIVSFLPMLFITGMMGPYMRPMAVNVPLSMGMSLLVAFTITPWMSYHVLKREYDRTDEAPWSLEASPVYRVYSSITRPFLESRPLGWALLGFAALLLGGALWLAASRDVPLKMLPFDNKNELQIVIDMPEGTTLERTDAAARALAAVARATPEVRNFQIYSGMASAMDFNGLVRHYYLRSAPNTADIRINLVPKRDRARQSHEIALALRNELVKTAGNWDANIKIVESPPGPPVIATIVAEVYGESTIPYSQLQEGALRASERLRREPLTVDVDTSVEANESKWTFRVDKEKAALSGVSTGDIAQTLELALSGSPAARLHPPDEANPLEIVLRLPRAERSSIEDLSALYLKGRPGYAQVREKGGLRAAPVPLVQLGELGRFTAAVEDQTVYRKDLRRVAYVFADTAGRAPAEAIIDVTADLRESPAAVKEPGRQARPLAGRTYLRNGGGDPWSLPDGTSAVWSGEGEWQITLDVFRDLGIAFAAACVGIYILLVYQTGSYFMPLILMISIPLTLIGIMPGFWLLNKLVARSVGEYPDPVYFTATAMIGMIALSGIAVRNAILLIEFVHETLRKGEELRPALLASGAVRFRPIFLTAGTAMLAALPITLDPIFSGLAWALIFGLFVSTAFTLLVIPVTYDMVYRDKPGHGLPLESVEDGEDTAAR